ncbi:MAG: exo-alpha-sialidase [Planctomycetes bacterium]|nr:exo-alpha-sialidase [Planctomycetota bacterium]
MTAAAQDSPVKTVVFPRDGRTVHRIPSIVVSTHGTILAFADRRVGSRSDWGHRTDVVLRRSTDDGETWQPVQTLFGQDSVCAHGGPAVVDRRTGRVFKFFRKAPTAFKNSAEMVTAMADRQEHAKWWEWGAGNYVCRSDDDGKTWTEPKRLKINHPEIKDLTQVGNGVHGVQLDDGTLVIQGGGGLRPHLQRWEDNSKLSFLLLNTNGGKTWEIGAQWYVAGAMREFALAPLAGGRLYVNQRARSFRRVAWLKGVQDETVTQQPDKNLIDPGCHAGLVMLRQAVDGQSVLLFSNPPNVNPHPDEFYPEGRYGLALRMSLDEGKTWSPARQLEKGLSAYSDLAEGRDGTIYCLYETGKSFYSENVTVARFGIEWLQTE